MSALLPFFTPTATSRPLVRSRFKLLASRLSALGTDTAASPLARAWLEALPAVASVDEGCTALRPTFAAAGPQLAPIDAVNTLLQPFARHLPDADFLTAAEMLDAARAGALQQAAARALDGRAAALARDLCEPVRAVFSQGDNVETSVDFDALEASVAAFLTDWITAAATQPPALASLVALQSFARHLASAHAAPTSLWQLLLQKTDSTPALEPIGAPALIEVLIAALPRFDVLRGAAGVLESAASAGTPAAAPLRALIELHLLVATAPRSTPALALAALAQPTAFATFATTARAALDEAGHALRDTLRRDYEQFQVDAWADAIAWIERLAALPAFFAEQRATLEPRLLAALQGESEARRLAQLGLELITTAAELSTAALDSAASQQLFRRHLIADLGADPTSAPWNQAPALSRALAGALAPAGSAPSLLAARTSLRGLDTLVAGLAAFPIGAARQTMRVAYTPDPIVHADETARAACRAEVDTLLTRLAIEHRTARGPLAQQAIVAWLAQNDLAPAAWTEAVLASGEKLPTELAAAARSLAAATPRVRAALHLRRAHESLGAAASRHVFQALPAYQASVGERGLKLCTRDNALTLLKLSRLLLSRVDDPADALCAWWNAVVAVYVVHRPGYLFEANFQGLHAALQAALDPTELDVVLPILHQLYKESLGMKDSPLLTFEETSDLRLHAAYGARPTGVEALAAALRTALTPRLVALTGGGAALAADFWPWFETATRALTLADHPEAALQQLRTPLRQLLAKHDPAGVARAFALLLAETTRAAAPAATPTARRAWSRLALLGLEAVSQEELAQFLGATWGEKAGPRLASAAPRGGGDEVAQAKCARDLALFNRYLARQLSTSSGPVAALNTIRFLVECILPYVDYATETWQEVFADWRRSQLASCPPRARLLFESFADFFTSLAPRLGRLHPVCAHTFRPGVCTFAADLGTEKAHRAAFALALLCDESANDGRFTRAELFRTGWRHGRTTAATRAATSTRLVAHADTLFDRIDGELYYWLQDQLTVADRTAAASLAPEPAPGRAGLAIENSLMELRESRGLLHSVTRLVAGVRPSDLAPELARARVAVGLAALEGDRSPARAAALASYLLNLRPAEIAEAADAAETSVLAALGSGADADRLRALLRGIPTSNATAAVAS